MDKTDLSTLIHSPAQLSAQYVDFAERMKQGGKIIWGVPSIDRRITPMPPGFVGGIIGRPGHGKSTIAAWLAKVNAQKIVEEGAEKECIVFVTLDQSVEEIESFFQCSSCGYSLTDLAWGNVDTAKIRIESINRVRLPIWTIGRSLVRRGKYVRLTVDVMYDSLRTIEREHGVHPRLIVIDYIQIVPVTHARERLEQVTEAICQAKELAMAEGTAMFLTSQASRRVDDYEEALPNESDSMWSSGFEQVIDRGFSIWRPIKKRGCESVQVSGERTLPVTNNLFLMRNWKNRFGDIGGDFYLHLDPSIVKLTDLERDAEEISPY